MRASLGLLVWTCLENLSAKLKKSFRKSETAAWVVAHAMHLPQGLIYCKFRNRHAPMTPFELCPALCKPLKHDALSAKSDVACLAVTPLTFAISIVRYRLVDIDFIFNRGTVY